MAELKKGSRITGAARDKLGSQLVKKYEKGSSIRALAEETGRSLAGRMVCPGRPTAPDVPPGSRPGRARARHSSLAVMNSAPLAGATYPTLIMQCQPVEIRQAWS